MGSAPEGAAAGHAGDDDSAASRTVWGAGPVTDGATPPVPGENQVGLSSSSVYPEGTARTFELAGRLGYDGVEVMVGIDGVSTNEDELERLRDFHQVPVLSIHAPCLIFTVRTWGTDPWEKLRRSGKAAQRLGCDVVVVHPPFRWQKGYAENFVTGIAELHDELGVRFCVENMYPWRAPKAGSREPGTFKAYQPGFDPTDHDFAHLTLDFSHASTARQQSLDLAKAWGTRLQHVHLGDGRGSIKDEHVLPGHGDQHADEVLRYLASAGYAGQVVLEANTRRSGSREQREIDLSESLAFARTHLAAGARVGTATA